MNILAWIITLSFVVIVVCVAIATILIVGSIIHDFFIRKRRS